MECQTNNLFHKYTQVFLNLHHFLTPRNLYPNVLEGRSLEGIVISRENAEEKKTQLLKNSKEKNSTCYKKKHKLQAKGMANQCKMFSDEYFGLYNCTL